MSDRTAACALCPYELGERICRSSKGKGPESCPTLHHARCKREAKAALDDPQVFNFARQASMQPKPQEPL